MMAWGTFNGIPGVIGVYSSFDSEPNFL